MRSWSTREYGVFDADGPRWRVYAKSKENWIPIGGVMSEAEAKRELERLREEGRLYHPHMVPA